MTSKAIDERLRLKALGDGGSVVECGGPQRSDDFRPLAQIEYSIANLSSSFYSEWWQMAHLDAKTSNELFEVLADWENHLKHQKSQDFLVPPCP